MKGTTPVKLTILILTICIAGAGCGARDAQPIVRPVPAPIDADADRASRLQPLNPSQQVAPPSDGPAPTAKY